ncbi:electron transport complex subunit RsxC [Thiomicrospira sp. WB1]|uniref:electron transport complex subunit RsxC n=1 Tax=Thiomicrospira sp. WB1 TaxID=1685380 RepID=UPI00074922BC|nr:electron transport complex subunit RsxC [Thiomicrospira sp. WB1]KUJ72181.1 electron transporter RnfC [Thiomicrospira sp. WB1]
MNALVERKPLKHRLIAWLGKLYPMAKRWLYHFHGGVFPKYHKSLSNRHPLLEDYIPDLLTLPVQQHLGVATEPLVQVGDRVLKYQRIADTNKGLSAPIHAPTSGYVTAIEPRILPHPSGLPGLCILIEPDGEDQAQPLTPAKSPATPQALKKLVHEAGIVGMGGAGFPTFAKIPDQRGCIEHLIINGAECEPFITCDDQLMQHKAQAIWRGAEIVAQSLGIPRVLCGIEDNKSQAIEAMNDALSGLSTASHEQTSFEVHPVATVYPMGGQEQLTQELLHLEIPSDKHAIEVGVLMMNVATLAAIAEAADEGKPLISRYVTVSGMGLEHPFNANVLLGTSFQALAEKASPKTALTYPLIQGGPMMGISMHSNNVPVIKTTNCVLANPPEAVEPAMPCIRCGECMDACPIQLLPQQLYWHSRSHEYDKVKDLSVFDCIECGCCSFVCPSHIPLVQYYRHAKSEIVRIEKEDAAAELAKQRHEFKQARIEKAEKAKKARLQAKKDAVKKQAAGKKPATGAAAAKARAAAAAKKAAAAKTTNQSETSPSEKPAQTAREKAMAAAKARAQKAKNQADNAPNTDSATTSTAEDKRKAAMAAAKKRAKTRQKTETGASPLKASDNAQSESDDKRQRAMNAAKQASKKGESSVSQEAGTKADTTAPTQDKRKAAMEAAKKRAKARQMQQTTPDQTESDQASDTED